MLAIKPYRRSFEDILKGPPLTAEEQLAAELSVPMIVRLQEYPDLALVALSGIVITPHQRIMAYMAHLGAGSNLNVSSRGTAKSSVWAVLASTHRLMMFSKRRAITLGAGGFRAGQVIFNDFKRWAEGGWADQLPGLEFIRKATRAQDIVHRGQNIWEITFKSMSTNTTVPTADEEKIRGLRATDLIIDEANFASESLIDNVAIPFLNVTGDFRRGGAHAKKNAVFFTTTVDYEWRPFQKRVIAAKEALQRDYAAYKAAKNKDWDTYKDYARQGLLDTTLVVIDYTDTIIREHGVTRDGRQYKVLHHPNPEYELREFPEGIPFTTRDERGFIEKYSGSVTGWTTYPIEKTRLEDGLLSGATDEASWLAEQRNVVDSAEGGVYPNPVVDRCAFIGDRALISYKECSDAYKRRNADSEEDYSPEVMWRCSDPCVLGVDYASSSDFSAFVVIRMGPLAKDKFDANTGLGKTKWSNVIWAEQHRGTSHKDVAEKVFELCERYNLVYHFDVNEDDPWQVCRAIGLDLRGGGTGVRDELLRLHQEDLLAGQMRIYDPRDKEERVQGFSKLDEALPMLDAIMAQDTTNSLLVEYTLGQMQQDLLFFPKWLPETLRQQSAELNIGYNGSKTLVTQLRKLRQKPTKQARTFYMEGSTTLVENKKDMWAAFIYAAKQMRAHIFRQRLIDDAPPPMGARTTKIGSKTGQRTRAAGAKRW